MLRYLAPFKIFVLAALCVSPLLAQQAIVAYNPGPSVNVKTFGAYGDVQLGLGGTNPTNFEITSAAMGTPPFALSDVGKKIWIDEAPFPAPILAGFSVTSSCMGTGRLTNNQSYPVNVYYRIAYTGTAGVGNVSVEGVAQIPPSASNRCAKITAPGNGGFSGITAYRVYFASDVPLRWIGGHSYSLGATVLDSNGNIEWTPSVGLSSCSPGPPPLCTEPTWSTTVGQPTTDGTITWTNEGPPVPGQASGSEAYQPGTSVCGSVGSDPSFGSNCEIDTIVAGSAPPSVGVFDGGAITSVNTTTNTATFTNSLSGLVLQENNYAWGHDDTTAIKNTISAMMGLGSGGTLFFPVSAGCYGITQIINTPVLGGSFLALAGEGSASSQVLGGPGVVEQRPSASCIATISGISGSQAGMTFPGLTTPISLTNAGPVVERLGFVDPFGSTSAALTFYTNASTRVMQNSFQGYASGTAMLFDAQETSAPNPFNYNQFVQVESNVCLSVLNCVVMKNGATNPAWIQRNRCVSAQTGGGRCVQLGPNLLELPPFNPPYNAGSTNWITENFALYFPISFESIDQFADYWIGDSDQQTSTTSVSQPNQNIIGSIGSGTGVHIGASATGSLLCFDNEIIGGNNTQNAVGLFIDPMCDRTMYLGFTVAYPSGTPRVMDFGTVSNIWNQESGMTVSAQAAANPFTVKNSSGTSVLQVQANGSLKFTGSSTMGVVTLDSAATGNYTFELPTGLGSGGLPLLSGTPLTFGPLALGSTTISGTVPLINGGTNADLSATGGASQYLKQSTTGGNVSVGTISPNDLFLGVDAQTGTSYTVASSDQGKLITLSNSSSIAVTLPQATGSFGAGWWALFENRNGGIVTITPTTSTIDGAAKYILNRNQGVILVSDGTNYYSSRGTAASVATSIQGGIWLPQGVLTNINTTSAQSASSGNQVRVFQITLPFSMTLGHANVYIGTTSSGAVNVGTYDPSGTKLTEASISCASPNAQQASFSPTFSLPAGVYYYAYSISDTTCTANGIATNTVMVLENNGSATRIGTAANPTVLGVMPSTLGTITSGSQPPVFAYIEP